MVMTYTVALSGVGLVTMDTLWTRLDAALTVQSLLNFSLLMFVGFRTILQHHGLLSLWYNFYCSVHVQSPRGLDTLWTRFVAAIDCLGLLHGVCTCGWQFLIPIEFLIRIKYAQRRSTITIVVISPLLLNNMYLLFILFNVLCPAEASLYQISAFVLSRSTLTF